MTMDDRAFAHAIWYGRGKEDEADPRALVAALVAEVEALRSDYWRLMPHDEPTKYLGYPQPGAAPEHYGPDDVVVDGDWLARELTELELYRHQLHTLRNAILDDLSAGVPDDVKDWIDDYRRPVANHELIPE